MNFKVLKTEAEYEAALTEAAALMDAAPDSADEEALELWGLLVREYEREHYPIDRPDPIDAHAPDLTGFPKPVRSRSG